MSGTKSNIIIVFILIAFCYPHHIWGQSIITFDLEKVAEHYDLVSTDLNCVFQDRSGYLWLGSKVGLSRFDGVEFENFTFTSGKSVAEIHEIVQTSDGVIWAGGINGLYFYKQGHLEKVMGLNQAITCLSIDRHGQLLVGGLLFVPFGLDILQQKRIISGDGVEKKMFIEEDKWQNTINYTRAWSITSDSLDNIYVGLDNQLIQVHSGEVRVIWEDFSRKIMISEIIAIAPDSIYWGSENTGLYFGKPNEFKIIEDAATYICHATDTALYFLSAIHLIKIDSNGFHILKDLSSYTDVYFKDLLLDKEGNFWIGSEGNLLKLKPRIFENWLFQDYPLLAANFSIDELESGEIVIGGSKEKILAIDDDTVQIFDRIEVPHNSITEAVFQDDEMNLWYGSSMGGIIWKSKNTAINFGIEDGLFDTEVLFFRKMPDGNLWCGGYNGICRILPDKNGYRFESFSFPRQRIDVPIFIDLIVSPNGDYWAVSDNGLYHLKEDTLLRFDLELEQDFPLISAASQVKDGKFLLSTQGDGVWAMEFTDQFVPELRRKYGKKDGLISDVALNVYVDSTNNLWIFYQNGISRLRKIHDNVEIRNYNEDDGLAITPTAKIKVLEARDGYLWVLRKTSISRFPLYQIHTNRAIPQTYIRGVSLQGEDGIDQYVTQRSFSGTPEVIILPHKNNFLEFDFTSTSFYQPLRNTFRYKLEGLENTWSEKSFNSSAIYRGLYPGSYTFYAQVFNSDGIPGSISQPVYVTILKPFYTRWWAIAFYFGIGLAAFYFGYRYHLDKRRREQESKRLKELDRVKNNMYTNITHEFRTPLTLILGQAEELEERITGSDNQSLLTSIKSNGNKLLQMVNDILALAKMEQNKIKQNIVQDDLVVFCRYLVESFHSLTTSKGIEIIFKSKCEDFWLDFDQENMRSILTNLISNSIKAVGQGGKIVIKLTSEIINGRQNACLTVEDNGVGIPQEDLPFIFERYYQVGSNKNGSASTGIGLALVRELTELINGSITVSSNAQGSLFKILIPVTRLTSKTKYGNKTLSDQSDSIENLEHEQSLILLIEDNEDVANFVQRMLRNEYEVLLANNGLQGLSIAQERLPDLIISDVMMPDIDGFEVCQQLKSDFRTDHIPVIMLTAKGSQEDRNYGIARGADAYLVKPFSSSELKIRIHQLIETRNKLAEKFGGGLMSIQSTTKVNKQSAFIQKVITNIKANIDDPNFSATQLAQKLSLSESQLYRKLKSVTDKSTAVFIRSVRLQQAKKMLQNEEFSISEVAYATGFNDPSWFSRAFKQEFGVAPSQIRQIAEEQ